MSDEVQKSLLIVGLFYFFFTTHFCGKTRLTGCGYIGEKDTGKDEKENINEEQGTVTKKRKTLKVSHGWKETER